MRLTITEIEQRMGPDDFDTRVTLNNGRRFKCLRPELAAGSLVDLHASDILTLDPDGKAERFFPVWLP
jgi:hypothetical protein